MQDIERHVVEFSGAVWEQAVGVPLTPIATPPAAGGNTFQGHVHIMGTWTGTVVLQCSEAAARRAAQAFFGDATPEDELRDMQDAVCELTNMIGGNLKAIVAEQGCTLSIPTVVAGDNYSVRIPLTRTVVRQPFAADDQLVVVTVLERKIM